MHRKRSNKTKNRRLSQKKKQFESLRKVNSLAKKKNVSEKTWDKAVTSLRKAIKETYRD